MQDGKHKLDESKYHEIWNQYFLSKNPADPANALFGVKYSKWLHLARLQTSQCKLYDAAFATFNEKVLLGNEQ